MSASGVATANSTGSALRPWQFQPGQSGNPLGRPKGLVKLVQAQTQDGAELVALYVAVMRGEAVPMPGLKRKQRPTLAQRLDAARELMDRGFGKAVQALEHTGADGEPIQHELRGALAVQAVDYRQAVVLRPPTVEMITASDAVDALPSPEADEAVGRG